MCTTIWRINGVSEGQFRCVGAVIILEGKINFHRAFAFLAFVNLDFLATINDIVNNIAVSVQIINEGFEAAFKIEGVFARKYRFALINQANGHAARNIGHLTEAIHQCLETVVELLTNSDENLSVWIE